MPAITIRSRSNLRWRGKPVHITDIVPVEHYADEIIPVLPRGIVAQLRRRLGLFVAPVAWRCGKRLEREQVFEMYGVLFMTWAMWERLKAENEK